MTAPAAPPPTDTFLPYTSTHYAVIAACLAITVAACVIGRKSAAHDGAVRFWWCVLTFITQIGHVIYWAMPARFNWLDSLPLQFCDIAPWLVIAALLWRLTWARALLFLWGIGLSSQAFTTPVLRAGPETAHFWYFWLIHLFIVGGAMYDLATGYRPGKRDLLWGIGLTVAYGVVMIAINVVFNLNYGFLGRIGAPGTPINAFGEWPTRLIPLFFVVPIGFAFLVGLAQVLPREVRTSRR